ncbi:hypothetical protein D3C76_1504320 [compost metagenome]
MTVCRAQLQQLAVYPVDVFFRYLFSQRVEGGAIGRMQVTTVIDERIDVLA